MDDRARRGLEREAELGMAELREDYPTVVAVAHTMECAGNGRGYFDPRRGASSGSTEPSAPRSGRVRR